MAPQSTARKEKKQKGRKHPYPTANGLPTYRAFVKQPIHAKWPSLFKRHIGLIESQIKVYDRLMMSMRSEMDQMEEAERLKWESGAEGHWHTLCGMMQRGKNMLDDALAAGKGILPDNRLRQKKSLGKMAADFRPVGTAGSDSVVDDGASGSESESENDAEISDLDGESESEKEKEVKPAPKPEFVPLISGKKRKLSHSGGEQEIEPNPYFVVDTEPTPVSLPKEKKIKKSKKSKDDELVLKQAVKRTSGDEQEPAQNRIKKHKKSSAVVPEVTSDPAEETTQPVPDFDEIERELQADIERRMKAKAESDAAAAKKGASENIVEVSKKDKKRKRTSTGSEVTEAKKVKKEMKRKAEGEDGGGKKRKGGLVAA
ncbi:hypothetical protein BJ878DRAFT_526460 [Calycina marina]|uniref:Uncharacterized protein n=1 Tax=Calycina marina TaxID=1763456 RepID=A0A9P8CBB0_9HELO|nr:hypothetical protein BJ878DRAFT_526460 [Calycina marina]